eukprot:6331619-Prorocentrum_lima.AAC.1
MGRRRRKRPGEENRSHGATAPELGHEGEQRSAPSRIGNLTKARSATVQRNHVICSIVLHGRTCGSAWTAR